MKQIQTEVLVIGGGATGAGVLRDLAMRGFQAVLVEKGDFSTGTTGRYHGLLHSGGRYAVKDIHAAIECIQENHILRRIMPHCIEDTGGFFIMTPWDDPEYPTRFLAGCKNAGIPVEEVPTSQMMREEPRLNPDIMRCFRVPDAAADSFLGTNVNLEAARQHGGQVFNYHPVIEILRSQDRVVGAICHDLVGAESIQILADMTINATGPWAGNLAAMVGVPLNIILSKGTLIAMNHRLAHTIINRCRLPTDGDVLLPAHTVSVMGTTDIKVSDPDHFSIEPWEIYRLLEEGERIIPGFQNMRVLRTWAGVRPLFQETDTTDSRDVSRSYVLLDHETREGVPGFITITSGKWTTFRKMAEVTVDLVCQKLETQRKCRTHEESLPDTSSSANRKNNLPKKQSAKLGERLAKVEEEGTHGTLVCECELSSIDDILLALSDPNVKSIDDVRRRTRLGMGPCQGGFCTFRVTGVMQKLRRYSAKQTNSLLREFLQERWKGLLPILWGRQLQQERLNELIYLSLLNADRLPESKSVEKNSISSAHPTEIITQEERANPLKDHARKELFSISRSSRVPEIIVIGGGLAGLTAAWRAALNGRRTHMIASGHGALYWHTGCIDILGYFPTDSHKPIESPEDGLSRLMTENPNHPYSIAGIPRVHASIDSMKEQCKIIEYPLHGDLKSNWLLPTATGVPRPTCLAPESMINGDMRDKRPILVIGFNNYLDFFPEWIAANITEYGITATSASIDISHIFPSRTLNAMALAKSFENQEFLDHLGNAISDVVRRCSIPIDARIGLPAVLGLKRTIWIQRYLESKIEKPVFEIPTLPPSIPGIRLSGILTEAFRNSGGRSFLGIKAIGSEISTDNQVTAIRSESAAREKLHQAERFILATGGILGGGIKTDYEGKVSEAIFNLPVSAPKDRKDWFSSHFLIRKSHPIYKVGIQINRNFQPIDSHGDVFNDNLYAIGTGLAGGEFIQERSYDGVALVSGYAVGEAL